MLTLYEALISLEGRLAWGNSKAAAGSTETAARRHGGRVLPSDRNWGHPYVTSSASCLRRQAVNFSPQLHESFQISLERL